MVPTAFRSIGQIFHQRVPRPFEEAAGVLTSAVVYCPTLADAAAVVLDSAAAAPDSTAPEVDSPTAAEGDGYDEFPVVEQRIDSVHCLAHGHLDPGNYHVLRHRRVHGHGRGRRHYLDRNCSFCHCPWFSKFCN